MASESSSFSIIRSNLTKIHGIGFGMWCISRFARTFAVPRAISSVGLEHRLDRAGVTGSNPVLPTKTKKNPSKYWGFLVFGVRFGVHRINLLKKLDRHVCFSNLG